MPRLFSSGVIYTFDTEFIEDGDHLDLISIGIACEDGRGFYAESSEVNWSRSSDWVLENVKPHLKGGEAEMTRAEIRDAVAAFVGADRPVFYGWYIATDWILLYRLFGRLIDLPEHWPKISFDLKQWAVSLGLASVDLPPDPVDAHSALADARWNLDAYRLLEAADPERAARLREKFWA